MKQALQPPLTPFEISPNSLVFHTMPTHRPPERERDRRRTGERERLRAWGDRERRPPFLAGDRLLTGDRECCGDGDGRRRLGDPRGGDRDGLELSARPMRHKPP